MIADSASLVALLKGKLIVSVQAYVGEPLRRPDFMAAMARACELGGAAAIRCQGLADIAAIKGQVEVPVIGLWKEGSEGVYITPTLRHARACVAAGADVVALDASDRPRPDGRSFEETVAQLKGTGVCLMADCRSLEDIRRGFAAGCDLCSTTLSHGTAATDCTMEDGPDIALIQRAVKEFPDRPVVCEGRVHAPADAARALHAGAWSVVVGTAITHPTSITSWFRAAVEGEQLS
ncbi:MAG: N-acetylmannosamine-6-phosphate 2-epimerase [Atopobium sp.]|nr:N-acetylmannosamine-6-phosphate 2-epimerase [Atopobium sp.]